jgi:hypothetical protein
VCLGSPASTNAECTRFSVPLSYVRPGLEFTEEQLKKFEAEFGDRYDMYSSEGKSHCSYVKIAV